MSQNQQPVRRVSKQERRSVQAIYFCPTSYEALRAVSVAIGSMLGIHFSNSVIVRIAIQELAEKLLQSVVSSQADLQRLAQKALQASSRNKAHKAAGEDAQ